MMNAMNDQVAERRVLLRDAVTGQTQSAVPQQPLSSSAELGWKGFLVEHHRMSCGVSADAFHLNHVLVLQLKVPIDVELEWEGRAMKSRIQPGQVTLFPAHMRFSARCSVGFEIVLVAFEQPFLARIAHEIGGLERLELLPKLGVDDPLVANLIHGLKAEVEKGADASGAYAYALASMLAIHIAQKYSRDATASRETSGGLTRRQVSQVVDFINERFSENLTLNTLAEVAKLSPFHFARLFKQSTGITPHQYVIQVRIGKGKEMLISSGMPIAEVARQVGFCDQSHFGTHFKRAYGVTPRAFVRQAAPRAKHE